MINTIIFDVDDTLYNNQKVFQKAFNTAFGSKDITYDEEKLFLIFRDNSDLAYKEFTDGILTKEEYRFKRLNLTLEEIGYYKLTNEDSNIFQKAYGTSLNEISIEEEMIKVLDYLKKTNVKLGIITNGPHDRQWKKISNLGLYNWIDRNNIFVSGDYQVSKPDSKIFKICEEKMMIQNTQNILYIGDSYTNDVIGAKKSGWKVLWLNHREINPPLNTKYVPDYAVNNFEDTFVKIKEIIYK